MLYDNLLKEEEKLKILSRIVAHLMGDGCVSKRYFAYYNKEISLINDFERDLKLLFGNIHIINGKVNSGALLRQVQNEPIRGFLLTLLHDYRSFSLEIPKFVNKRILYIEFLRALYDDEGCVALRIYKKTGEIKRNITLSSNSLKLIEQIKYLLETEFAIKSNKIQKYVKKMNSKECINYVLSITGKVNFDLFSKYIGFYHPEKILKLDLMIKSYIRPQKTG